MNFLAVNNQQCVLCNDCYRACPVKAISIVNGAVSIDYDLCIACGLCFKACTKSAITLNIDTIKFNAAIEDAKELKTQKNAIEKLEIENKYLRNKIERVEKRFATLVDKLPLAVMAINRNSKIMFLNDKFSLSLGSKAREYIKNATAVSDLAIDTLFDTEMFQIIKTALHSDQEITTDVDMDEGRFNLSVYPIKKDGAILIFLRNLYDLQITEEEIESRIVKVIDQNMSMVQNIGFLMGEEASKTTKVLNSIVDLLNYQKKLK